MLGVQREIRGAHIVGTIRIRQNFCPVSASVCTAVHAALGVGFVNVAEGGDIDAIRVVRIDHNFADLAGFGETDGTPSLACIRGLENADPVGMLTANVRLTRTDINNIRLRRSYGNRTN